ncbi:hypothetical protein F5Y14DRAFT_431347 [Nemania sp. NC0429]|nr:hypothetical protein F5Y14DRAFT_431347 [Nemania sp. NC0429]
MPVARLLSLLALSIAGFPGVKGTVQDDWPSPAKYSTWYTRQTYLIRWDTNLQNSFGTYCPSCDTSNVDLWITPASLEVDDFYRIASAVNVQTTTSYEWTVPDSFTAGTWVFRFIPAGTQWINGGEEISSRIFYTELSATESSSSALSSSSSPSISSTPTSSSTPSSSSTPTSSPTPTSSSAPSSSPSPGSSATSSGSSSLSSSSSQSSSSSTGGSSTPSDSVSMAVTTKPPSNTAPPSTTSTDTPIMSTGPQMQAQDGGLSAGAKAGIAVGALVGALLLVALGFFLAKRQHQRSGVVSGGVAPHAQSRYSPSAQHTFGGTNNDHPDASISELSHYPQLNHTVAELAADPVKGSGWPLRT